MSPGDDARPPSDPSGHYDRVTPAWGLVLGEDLHYGCFESANETLAEATLALTLRMAERAKLAPGQRVLDVGCGTGHPACLLAERFGCRVEGISTSPVGIGLAQRRIEALGLSGRVDVGHGDGMDNGRPAETYDRVWVLESSHLMPDKEKLLSECARVLKPGGRLVLCDIILRAPMPLAEVIRYRDEILLLRDVFGEAKMESLEFYGSVCRRLGLQVDACEDLTRETFPTFEHWRRNATGHRARIVGMVGEPAWRQFLEGCRVLERMWNDGKLGYGLIAAAKVG